MKIVHIEYLSTIYYVDCFDNIIEAQFSEFWHHPMVYIKIEKECKMVNFNEIFLTKEDAIRKIKETTILSIQSVKKQIEDIPKRLNELEQKLQNLENKCKSL